MIVQTFRCPCGAPITVTTEFDYSDPRRLTATTRGPYHPPTDDEMCLLVTECLVREQARAVELTMQRARDRFGSPR